MELTSQLRHVQNNNVNISKYSEYFNTTLTFKNSALESRNVILNLLINFGDKQRKRSCNDKSAPSQIKM